MSRAQLARRGVVEPGPVALLAELLRDTPRLEGAVCATKRGYFMEAETGNRVRVDQCISICRRCPALQACRQWAATQPGLVGVVAGKLHATVRADDGDDESSREAGTMTDNVDLTGIGTHRPCPARGVLVFDHLPLDVQNAEDARQEADHRNRHWRSNVVTERPASATERALLAHLGHELPEVLHTRVQWLTDGVRRRTWPQIPATLEGLSE